MDTGLNEDIWSKRPTLLDCYALVWNPVPPWKPLSVLPRLSPEFDFVPTKSLNKSWNVYKVIDAMYLGNAMAAFDKWIDVLRKPFQKEKKIDVNDGMILQLDLLRMDIQEKCNGKDEELLEMVEEFQNLRKVWIDLRKNHNEIHKGKSNENLNEIDENNQENEIN